MVGGWPLVYTDPMRAATVEDEALVRASTSVLIAGQRDFEAPGSRGRAGEAFLRARRQGIP